MSWEKSVQETLERYYDSPEAIVVCIAVFRRFKALEMASIKHEDTAGAVLKMMMDDYLILVTNSFWLMHGGAISVEVGNRFFDFLKAQRLLQAHKDDKEKLRRNLQSLQLRDSFMGVADVILRLHVPFSQYTRDTVRLYEDLQAIEGL